MRMWFSPGRLEREGGMVVACAPCGGWIAFAGTCSGTRQVPCWPSSMSWSGLAQPPTTVLVASGKVVGDGAKSVHDAECYDRSSVDSVIPPQALTRSRDQ